MIELEHVRRTYGAKVAVVDLNLVVPAGEVFAFLGPNGAGKTTTIKIMVTLLRPTSGAARICGRDVVRAPRETNRCVGYVPDEPQLYDKLTGREFLDFLGRMRGMSRMQFNAALEREVARFELESFVDNFAESYSHGMKQRLVFAAAFLHDPPVLIVDEPMVGLDPRNVRKVKDLLQSQARVGKTVFMSTHSLAIAEQIADRIGIIDRGELQFLGTLAELREQHARAGASLEDLFLKLTEGDQYPHDAPA